MEGACRIEARKIDPIRVSLQERSAGFHEFASPPRPAPFPCFSPAYPSSFKQPPPSHPALLRESQFMLPPAPSRPLHRIKIKDRPKGSGPWFSVRPPLSLTGACTTMSRAGRISERGLKWTVDDGFPRLSYTALLPVHSLPNHFLYSSYLNQPHSATLCVCIALLRFTRPDARDRG